MSIWATTFDTFDDDNETGDLSPIQYHGSHVLPDPGHNKDGWIDCAVLPAFVRQTREHPNDPNDPNCIDGIEPYLRFGVTTDTYGGATLVLTPPTVAALRDYLTEWLTRIDDTDK